jgi:hypothetical protein
MISDISPSAYVDAVPKAMMDEGEFNRTYDLPTGTPNLSTRRWIKAKELRTTNLLRTGLLAHGISP